MVLLFNERVSLEGGNLIRQLYDLLGVELDHFLLLRKFAAIFLRLSYKRDLVAIREDGQERVLGDFLGLQRFFLVEQKLVFFHILVVFHDFRHFLLEPLINRLRLADFLEDLELIRERQLVEVLEEGFDFPSLLFEIAAAHRELQVLLKF